MQIVIDIPDNYMDCIDNYEKGSLFDMALTNAIKNGIPLPKGHGRLIDADELFLDIQTDEQMRLGEHLAWVRERIEDAPTIIEADSREQ